jgi:hypothetical protein
MSGIRTEIFELAFRSGTRVLAALTALRTAVVVGGFVVLVSFLHRELERSVPVS